MSGETSKSMRFPLASLPQVRREVARQVGRIPRAKWWFLGALVLLSAGAYASVLAPQVLGRIVDLVSDGAQMRDFVELSVILIAVAIAGAVLSACGFYVVSRISEKIIANLREDMVGTALGLPTHQVEDAGSGDLVKPLHR